MMATEGSTKILTFMTPGAAVPVLLCAMLCYGIISKKNISAPRHRSDKLSVK